MPDRHVRDIMTRDLTALSRDTALREAARLFSMLRVTGLPVVDEHFKVIGFLSEADIISAVAPRSRDRSGIFVMDFGEIARKMGAAGEARVADYMTEHALTVTEDVDLLGLSETMLTEGIKVLPVVRDGMLIGTVNRADVCRALMEDRWESS
ncbi:MAG: CBS domain-containing protein [Coriobacteriia bacterium]|nr:CBS domain-containing protein [Anaerosomatales bacterium]